MPEDGSAPDAIAVAIRDGAAIEEVGGRYFVGGSLASSLQGEPRATNDIDMVVDLPAARTADLVAALGGDFEVDEDALPEDTVLRKLLWYLDGGGVSDRQWRDVVEVLRVSGAELDRGYLGAWAERLHLSKLLERALIDSET